MPGGRGPRPRTRTPEVLPPIVELEPVMQQTGVLAGEAGDTGSALLLAKAATPKITRRLIELALTSPNHHASRAACRDVLQVAGLLADTTKLDVVVTFRGIFAEMDLAELEAFRHERVFPERLRAKAMKLLQQAA